MPSGYQKNMVYNIVQQLVLENTGWFTAEEKAQIRNNPSLETSKLDSILLDKLSTQLLSNITAQITYAEVPILETDTHSIWRMVPHRILTRPTCIM